jgi:hypothetical protein
MMLIVFPSETFYKTNYIVSVFLLTLIGVLIDREAFYGYNYLAH